ncbi:hypothetical protein PC118_g21483 [Phytophthora cactorum]|uniref:Elicitin n=1 Tax=Phytophthora cactorum TaxID=29920 RepID=A0A8T1F5L1_9STRA|nr:hypothetical protein PC118_g21483 [Phytophthora cactorum]
MKPFRLRSLGVAAFFLAAADTTQVAAIDLEATVVYTASGDCGASTGTPVLVTAVPPSSSCATSVLCTETPASSSLFPATVCSTTDGTANGAFINTKLPAIFGSSPVSGRRQVPQDGHVEELPRDTECGQFGDH